MSKISKGEEEGDDAALAVVVAQKESDADGTSALEQAEAEVQR